VGGLEPNKERGCSGQSHYATCKVSVLCNSVENITPAQQFQFTPASTPLTHTHVFPLLPSPNLPTQSSQSTCKHAHSTPAHTCSPPTPLLHRKPCTGSLCPAPTPPFSSPTCTSWPVPVFVEPSPRCEEGMGPEPKALASPPPAVVPSSSSTTGLVGATRGRGALLLWLPGFEGTLTSLAVQVSTSSVQCVRTFACVRAAVCACAHACICERA